MEETALKRSERNKQYIAETEREIAKKLPTLLQAIYDLAVGVYIGEEGEDGTVRVYRERPDRQALQWLLERVLGKTPERHELVALDNVAMVIPWAPASAVTSTTTGGLAYSSGQLTSGSADSLEDAVESQEDS